MASAKLLSLVIHTVRRLNAKRQSFEVGYFRDDSGCLIKTGDVALMFKDVNGYDVEVNYKRGDDLVIEIVASSLKKLGDFITERI